MIKSANIATQPSRINVLSKMIDSVYDQFDVIRVYLNEFDSVPEFLNREKITAWQGIGMDLTDNGKFFGMGGRRFTLVNVEPEYYFTLDDDIIYPPDYVEKTVENIDKFGCIITYHGRLLRGKGLRYYKDHEFFSCVWESKEDFEIDVCGTGVTAFRTDYFCPNNLALHEHQRMSDIIFSLEAAKQGKTIGYCKKAAHWIKPLEVNESIYSHFTKNRNDVQNKLADEIFTIKYGKV